MQIACDMDCATVPSNRAEPSRFAEDRIDGWKSIAAYFGRDRTTVIRWARERALPVHRLPGGRVGTVYALRGELDRWAKLPADGTDAIETVATVATVADAGPALPVARFRPRLPAILAAMLTLVAVPLATLWPAATVSSAIVLPADAAVASRFLMARDLVAARTAASLTRGIALLQDVTAAAPDFAPGHAALAEALLLSREFAQQDDAEAFDRARVAARRSLRLAPDLPMARRAMGFIAYWADHDRAESDLHFRAALAADPDDALTRFWYGNILSDRGDHAAALRELDRARLGMPGSVALMTDYGWALWAAGRESEGRAILRWVEHAHPDFATAHESLSIIALVDSDFAAYARHVARVARLRGRRTLQLDAADPMALRRIVTDRAVRQLERGSEPSPAVAMLIAARTNRWDSIAARLRIGEARRERWGEAPILDWVVRLSPDANAWGARMARRKI
ncbi:MULTISPECIES: hypothetical protein [unclassified Sphingomonas]|uniref:hypothetical protein n=1 Tax=unclassified Sphingomonas TaxID=196159 RepID=UPI000ACBC6F6|nr:MULTISPECIES: hypothetical protein [unclassified Sphingomonas]